MKFIPRNTIIRLYRFTWKRPELSPAPELNRRHLFFVSLRRADSSDKWQIACFAFIAEGGGIPGKKTERQRGIEKTKKPLAADRARK